MEQGTIPEFVVIDDDLLNNIICEKIIQYTIPGAEVQTFNEPEKALEYIQSAYSGIQAKQAVLFLDINMPSLTGWEVLDRLKKFPDLITEHLKIFMLSSSVDPKDEEKAVNNPLVTGYIRKSLSQVKLQTIFPEYAK